MYMVIGIYEIKTNFLMTGRLSPWKQPPLEMSTRHQYTNLSLVSATQDDENRAGSETRTKLVFVFAECLLAIAQFLGSLFRRVVPWLKPTQVDK